MENISFIKKELLKDFKDVKERANLDNSYILSLSGDFKHVCFNDRNPEYIEFHPEFQHELFKVLPKDVLTLGYICGCCGTYMTGYPNGVCTMCEEYYIEKMEEEKDEECNKYCLDKMEHELTIVFTTESKLDMESIKSSFKPMKYIKKIYICKNEDEEALEGNQNVTIYNEMIIVDEN